MTKTTGKARLPWARRTALIGGLAAVTLTAGCSLPDWADMSSKPKPAPTSSSTSSSAKPAAQPSSPASPTAGPSAGPSAKPSAAPRGDLKAGSLTRVLDAGSSKLVVAYWTKQNPGAWTAADSVPVQFSAHLEDAGATQTVYVSRFVATLDDGTNVKQVSEDKGSFVITPPYSYSGALTVHPSDPSATSADLSIEFDLLVETAPGSGQFFRQTVLDTVHLEFAR